MVKREVLLVYGTVDRFEGDYAIIETDDGQIINIKKDLLPKNIEEGDVIDLENMIIDREETLRRKNNIQKLADELFEEF